MRDSSTRHIKDLKPDFPYNMGTFWIMVCVDEHGNSHSKKSGCHPFYDELRMVNMTAGIGMPVIFIRYNPHAYKDAQGRRQNPKPSVRRKTLYEMIRYAMRQDPVTLGEGAVIYTMYLYYNGYNPSINHVIKPFLTED